MVEYEKLSDNKAYSDNLQKVNYDLAKKVKLAALKNLYSLLVYDKIKAIKELEYWGVYVKDNKIDDLKKVESRYKQLKTEIKIDDIRNQHKESKVISFDKMFINVNSGLNGVLKSDLTLSEWCAALQIINDRNKEIKK